MSAISKLLLALAIMTAALLPSQAQFRGNGQIGVARGVSMSATGDTQISMLPQVSVYKIGHIFMLCTGALGAAIVGAVYDGPGATGNNLLSGTTGFQGNSTRPLVNDLGMSAAGLVRKSSKPLYVNIGTPGNPQTCDFIVYGYDLS